MKKERLYYLDIARGVAILFIVLGHLVSQENMMIKWIYSFHVILFFIISGYLLRVKSIENIDVKQCINTRIKTVLIPYFMFSIVFIVTDLIVKGVSISVLLWNIIYTLLFFSPSALWFLPAFFIGEILFISISKINNKYIKFILVLISFIVPYLISLRDYNFIMLLISRGLVSSGFITIGYYSKNILDKISIVQAVMLLAVTFITAQLNLSVDLYSLRLGNLVLYIFNGVLASVSIIVIAKTLNRNKYLEFCGVNTIIIMGTHQWMTRLFTISYPDASIVITISVFIIIMLIEIPIIYLINNKMPWMLGKFKNKEKTKVGLA